MDSAMQVSPVTPQQLNCVLTPARARAALTAVNAKPLGGNLENHLAPDEVAAVRELFEADASGAITLRAIVHRIARATGDAFPLPRALVLWRLLKPHQKAVVRASSGDHLSECLAYVAEDLDLYAALAGVYFEGDAPEWRICVAHDLTRYGYITRRAATLEEALATISEDDIDDAAATASDGNFGHRISYANAIAAGDGAGEQVDLDRPVGDSEVWVRPVGEVAAWRQIAERVIAEGEGGDLAAIVAQAHELMAPFRSQRCGALSK